MLDSDLKYGFLFRFIEWAAVYWALLITTYTLPSCNLVYCSINIVVFLWKQRKTLAISQNCVNNSNFQKEKKTTVLIAVILTIYILGTLPMFIYVLIMLEDPNIFNANLFEFRQLIWCVTALVDFFLLFPEFQKGYRKILCCHRKSRIIQVAPWSSVEPFRSSLPLVPRRQFGVTLSGQATAMKADKTEEGRRGHPA